MEQVKDFMHNLLSSDGEPAKAGEETDTQTQNDTQTQGDTQTQMTAPTEATQEEQALHEEQEQMEANDEDQVRVVAPVAAEQPSPEAETKAEAELSEPQPEQSLAERSATEEADPLVEPATASQAPAAAEAPEEVEADHPQQDQQDLADEETRRMTEAAEALALAAAAHANDHAQEEEAAEAKSEAAERIASSSSPPPSTLPPAAAAAGAGKQEEKEEQQQQQKKANTTTTEATSKTETSTKQEKHVHLEEEGIAGNTRTTTTMTTTTTTTTTTTVKEKKMKSSTMDKRMEETAMRVLESVIPRDGSAHEEAVSHCHKALKKYKASREEDEADREVREAEQVHAELIFRRALERIERHRQIRLNATERLALLSRDMITSKPHKVRKYVILGADVNYKTGEEFRPALHQFIRYGQVACVAECLRTSRAIDFTCSDEFGWTPLHLVAAWSTPTRCTEMLRLILDRLDAHADKDTVNWEARDKAGNDVISYIGRWGFLSQLWPMLKTRVSYFRKRVRAVDRYPADPSKLILLTSKLTPTDWDALDEEQAYFMPEGGFKE